MARQSTDATLIPSTEDIADDIVLADDSQTTNSDDQRTLVTAQAVDDQAKDSKSDEYEPPKFDDIKEFLKNEDGLDIYQLVAFRIRSGNGCCACRKKQNIDEEDDSDKTPPQCPDYHDLKYHKTTDSKFSCDKCGKSMEEGSELW
eukprot:CAMPEP_0201570218 /NCGR_PEP_ID=MMETSP0190_2-20130828/12365_1 /ASSEMBLY_ACC=CAM_ASM_000263 /TAXON_ID=37353 /ORGANISM="Rosalina sp." /LENGTH=144 /DNA_ID=CAMNT_0047993509 /DNA_START=105 /DNA_END=536 /DNA_ORIENTATION=-